MPQTEKVLDVFQKAVDVATYAGTSGVGSPLVRQDLEAEILKLTNRNTPLRDMVKRTKGEGRAHMWNQRTTLGTGSNPMSLFYADGGTPNFSDPTYVQKTAAYKYLGTSANITGPMIATGRSFTDIEAEVAEKALRELVQGEEWALFKADSSALSIAFDGIDVQVITNVTSNGGLALTNMDNVDSIIKKVRLQGGLPNAIFCSFGMQAIISRLLMPDVRYIAQQGTTVTAGIFATNYQSPVGVLPIVGDFFINPINPYPYNTTSSSSATGNAVSSIYVLDTNELEVVELQGVGRTELAKIADTVRFYINEYIVLAVKAEVWQGILTNVSDPA